MKKYFTALFLLVCLTLTFFIPANAKDYTVNDILNTPEKKLLRLVYQDINLIASMQF